jgi:glycosyl transferase family 87
MPVRAALRATAIAALALALLLGVAARVPAQAAGTSTRAPAAAATTTATTQTDPNAAVPVPTMDKPPAGYRRTGTAVQRIAERNAVYRAEKRRHRGAYPNVYTKGAGRWQVSLFSAGAKPKELAQLYVDDATGRVTEAWTGFQVAWTMARGYPGAFGRKVNAPWVWIPLTILFIAPFFDWRRPLRMLHLDLLVLAAFGVSVAFFNDAQIGISVPIAYPLLAYLLGRALWLGLRRDRPRPALRLLVPVQVLAIVLVFLIGFRIALNVMDSNVIDVGYAGVIGANRIADGTRLYGNFPKDNEHGDTYGPVNYVAYVPFERIWPWSGTWNDLPAAHAASVVFDLACLLLLFLVGRRVRGPDLGVMLAYAWAAYPFTLYAMDCNVNDALVGALVLCALLAAAAPLRRGVFVALAGMAKFAPLALGPLYITQTRRRVRFAVGMGIVLALSFVFVLVYGDPRTFFDRTLGFQASRGSPFSIWGLRGWTTAQTIVQVAGVILAVAVAFLPRRRDLIGLAALSAAVMIGLQLGITHWFYLYIVWFYGPLMVALLGVHGSRTWSMESARNGFDDRMTTPISHGSSADVSNRTDIWVRSDSIA